MRRLPETILIALCLILQACNQPFQPDGAYDGRLAVYAVLSSSSDTQFVRITRSYQSTPAGDVTDAVVDIFPGDGSPTAHLRDTSVIHYDASGQAGTYNVYVAYNFRPRPSVSYELSATSPGGGTVQGTTQALGPATATLLNPASLTTSPDSVVLSADFGTSTGAYVLQLFIEYEVTIGATTTKGKTEVPVATSDDASGKQTFQYPAFAPVPLVTQGNGFATAFTWFPKDLYARARLGVTNSNPPGSVKFTAVMYSLTQIDQALYDYYYILNGPKDLSTIRLDAPDFSNITNGLGVIASTQMIVHEVPLGQ
jgi:hypothetical protein